MSRNFDFSDLVACMKTCPLCDKDLTYQISTTSGDDISAKLQNHFDTVINKSVAKRIKAEFNPACDSEVEFKEINLVIKPNENKCLVDKLESAMSMFGLKIYCSHDIVGYGYEAVGYFDFDVDFRDEASIPKEGNKLCIPTSKISIDYILYKIVNIHLNDEKPNGNFIKILNDFNNNKTSFSMAETTLDGSWGTWKEKRLDLVDDSFFKYHNSEKIYSRINSIFLLK